MTTEEVMERLHAAVAQYPTQTAFCQAHGVSTNHLSTTVRGLRPLGPLILRTLGLRRVVTVSYEAIDERQAAA